jgi:ribulose-5-phosphate 4-epimerase/fuculose-1-phosphate aldolase
MGESELNHGSIDQLRRELVYANRVLVSHRIVDAFGHVSARHPDDPSKFLMARRIPPALVEADDVLEYGLDAELVVNDGTPVFLERFIHGEVYAARPDVQAVVHSHSANIIAFGVVRGRPLRALCHTCGFLGLGAPVFEMRDAAGDATDLLITSREKGRALAAALGDSSVVLMRGHGSTGVGLSVAQAVYRAVYTETNAQIQATASALGEVSFLTPGEAQAAEGLSSAQVERTWQLWKAAVQV